MDRSEITQKVIQTLAKMLSQNEEDITPQSRLLEDLSMDSFTGVEMLFELEDQYKIEIPDEEVGEFKIVEDIVESIMEKLGKGQTEKQ